jgi:integrase
MSFVPTGAVAPIFQGFNPTGGVYYMPMPMVYRSLNEEELTRLFAAIPDTVQGRRDRAFFLVALLTLRRRSELLRLRWGDISRGMVSGEHGTLHQGYMYSYTTKGSGQRRSKTELPGLAYRVICEYLAADGRLNVIGPGDPIFIADASARGCKPAPGAPLAGSTLLRNLKTYAKAAGLEMKPCLHSFRHSGIQQRLKNGQQPLDIMRISGHRSMDNFYRYTQHLMGEADPGASAIEQRFAYLAE